jgi:hypothetical protein
MMSSAAIGAPAGHVSPSSQLKLTLIPLRRCIGIEGLSQRSGIGDTRVVAEHFDSEARATALQQQAGRKRRRGYTTQGAWLTP